MEQSDAQFMTRALRLARKGLYTAHPNPRVGCVLVKGGQIIGEGFHRRAGEPHAEINALVQAGAAADGATAYVTLEPCCHHGRTPPCSDALLDAGVSRVVVAMRDPNPLVSGKGLEQMRQAGVEVTSGVMENQARELNPGFIKRMREGLPYVRCKSAMSLDGRTAMASGESKWITGEAARRDVQRLRARSSAVATGIDTVLADDPSLNVRLEPADLPGAESDGVVLQPVRVVLDSRLRMPESARMLGLAGQTLVLTADENPVHRSALEARGAHVVSLPEDRGHLDLASAFGFLAEQEINEVLLEAGPTLAGSVLAAGLVDELVIYVAPHLMGNEARGLFRLPGVTRMEDRISVEIVDVRSVGQDLRITALPRVRH